MQPLRVKGWDKALLEYTLAMLTDSASEPPLASRLTEISCPGIVMQGIQPPCFLDALYASLGEILPPEHGFSLRKTSFQKLKCSSLSQADPNIKQLTTW